MTLDWVLRRLPIRGEHVDLRPVSWGKQNGKPINALPVKAGRNQAVVWISLIAAARSDWHSLPADHPRVPALLDTGCNAGVVMNRTFFRISTGREHGAVPGLPSRVRSTAANFQCETYLQWAALLHRNQVASHLPQERSHFRLDLHDVAVHELGVNTIPLIGMRALTLNKLHFHLDGADREANLVRDGALLTLARPEGFQFQG